VESPHIPARVQIRFPKHLRKYKKRTLKRWADDPRNWTDGPIYRTGNTLMCHPQMAEKIRFAFRASLTPAGFSFSGLAGPTTPLLTP